MRVQGIVSNYSSLIMRHTRRLGLGGLLALVRAEIDFPVGFFSLIASFLIRANVWFLGLDQTGDPWLDEGSRGPGSTKTGGEGIETLN